MYRRVLVPLDGSTLAECALTHVKMMVKEGFVGQVTLLNVVRIESGGYGEQGEIRRGSMAARQHRGQGFASDHQAFAARQKGSTG
jgi:hypothetical protein